MRRAQHPRQFGGVILPIVLALWQKQLVKDFHRVVLTRAHAEGVFETSAQA